MMNAMELRFDPGSTCDETPHAVDGEWVLVRALELEFRGIRLNWAGLVEVELPVEDDIMFLAMGYAELEDFSCSATTHRLFLADGLLDVSAVLAGNMVTITVSHTPHLDRRFTNTMTMTIQLSEYLQAWRSLMRSLLAQLHPSS